MSEQNEQGAVALPDPGAPADQGLSSLGLLMQLGGSILAAYASLVCLVFLLAPGMGGQRGWLLLVLAACVTRSLFHRAAGTELLYGRPSLEGGGNRLAGVRRYIVVALIQSAVLTAIMIAKFHLPTKYGISLGIGFALWPAALAILLQLPRFKRFEHEIPMPEDKGFEGAAILMAVLGTCGVLVSGAFLLIMLDAGSAIMRHGPGVLILAAVVTLVIRSIFHVQAGLTGLRETNLDRAVELSNRYANFGVISSFCVGAAILLLSMMGGFSLFVVIGVGTLVYMLMLWPLIIRRFFSDRQFADLLAGDKSAIHRRAPDAGLTSLGWLLFAHAMFGAVFVIPQIVLGHDLEGGGMTEMMAVLGPTGTRSIWWSTGLVVLQAWAGLELVRMTPTSRIVATVYAVVAAAIAVYVMWPMLNSLGSMRLLSGGLEAVMSFVTLAVQLVIPVATLILVNRKITPTATARFKQKAA